MEVWSDSELRGAESLKIDLGPAEKLSVLQHAYAGRMGELLYMKGREDKLILWLASFFTLSIMGGLVFNSAPIHWFAKLFFSAITGLVGWYGSEYIADCRDEMQNSILLMHEIREEISECSYGFSRELFPDPAGWETASRWEMGPADLFLKGAAITAIVTVLFA